MSVSQAIEAGTRSLVTDVAPIGGVIPDSWLTPIEEAARAGMEIICGLHLRLAEIPVIATAAKESRARLYTAK